MSAAGVTCRRSAQFNYSVNYANNVPVSITITLYTGPSGAVTTPSSIYVPAVTNSLPVTTIGQDAFYGSDLISVYFTSNTPTVGDSLLAYDRNNPTVCYLANTAGWSNTFA